MNNENFLEVFTNMLQQQFLLYRQILLERISENDEIIIRLEGLLYELSLGELEDYYSTQHENKKILQLDTLMKDFVEDLKQL